jgi:hypothetical protein
MNIYDLKMLSGMQVSVDDLRKQPIAENDIPANPECSVFLPSTDVEIACPECAEKMPEALFYKHYISAHKVEPSQPDSVDPQADVVDQQPDSVDPQADSVDSPAVMENTTDPVVESTLTESKVDDKEVITEEADSPMDATFITSEPDRGYRIEDFSLGTKVINMRDAIKDVESNIEILERKIRNMPVSMIENRKYYNTVLQAHLKLLNFLEENNEHGLKMAQHLVISLQNTVQLELPVKVVDYLMNVEKYT